MQPQALKSFLRKNLPAAVYLFTGQESLLKKELTSAIIESVPQGTRDFNVNIYYGGEAQVSEIVTAARTLPFSSPRQVVVVRNLEKVKSGSGGAVLLEEYIREPSPETTLVLSTDEQSPGRTWAKKLAGLATVVDFRPLKGKSLLAMVREEARRKELDITGDAVSDLAETVGSDLGRVRQEIEKLSLAVDKGKRVDVSDIHRLVCGYSYQTIFDLVKAVSNRNLAASLRQLPRVLESGQDAIGLIGMLGKRLRVFWYLTGRGETLPKAFRVQGWQLDEAKGQAARFSRKEIEDGLEGLLLADYRLKTSVGPPRVILERFLIDFIGARGLRQ